jgi:hypothetical protein
VDRVVRDVQGGGDLSLGEALRSNATDTPWSAGQAEAGKKEPDFSTAVLRPPA